MKLRFYIAALHVALFTLLLAVSPAGSGSMTLLGVGKSGAAGGRTCTDDTASANFLARTSGLTNVEADAYCKMIKGLESDAIITGNLSGAAGCGSVLDGLYITATNTTTTANLNLCGTSFTLVVHGSVSFSADHGYTGGGTNADYIDTTWVPTTNGVNFTRTTAHASAYLTNNRTTNATMAAFGAGDSANANFNQTELNPFDSSGHYISDINSGDFPQGVSAAAKGYRVIDRTVGTSVNHYVNGAFDFTYFPSNAVTETNQSILILAFHDTGGAVAAPSTDTITAFTIGGTLGTTKAIALSGWINGFMTDLGINVY